MNNWYGNGRLSKDPELRYTQKGTAVTEFQIAVDSGYGDNKKTNWISIVAWGKVAEFVCENAAKGTGLLVNGEIETGSYEGNNGKVYTTKVTAGMIKIVKSFKHDEDEYEERHEKKKTESKGKKKVDNPFDDDEDD